MSKILFINRIHKSIDLSSNESYLFIIENKECFYSMLYSLSIEMFDENLTLFSDNKKDTIENYIDNIPSLFNLDINNKKNLNALYKQIKTYYHTNFEISINKISNICDELFKEIYVDFNLELYSNFQIKSDDLFKIMNIKIQEKSDSLLNSLLSYIKVSIELRKTKVFILNNLLNMLEKAEIELFLKECKLMNIIVINFESIDIGNICFDNKVILDKDICIID